MAVIFWVLLRMDNTNYLLRGWRESLAGDNAMSGEQAQAYSLVIEKYLLAGEKRGWVVGVESAKQVIGRSGSPLDAWGNFGFRIFAGGCRELGVWAGNCSIER